MADKKDDLKTLIEQRKKEAEDKKIFIKAVRVAEYLGTRRSLDSSDQISTTWGSEYTFEGNGLKIVYSTTKSQYSDGMGGGCSVDIYYDGQHVSDGGRTKFIPGDWEPKLDALYKKATAVWEAGNARRIAEEKGRKILEENKERKNWGL